MELGGYSHDDLSRLRAYGVQSANHTLTMVLINVQDPSAPRSTTDSVRLDLPASYHAAGSALTLQSSAPGGFASLDASAITLGGRRAVFDGAAPRAFDHTTVPVKHAHAIVEVAPGTARIVRFPDVQLPEAVHVASTTGTARPVTATLRVPTE